VRDIGGRTHTLSAAAHAAVVRFDEIGVRPSVRLLPAPPPPPPLLLLLLLLLLP
jgi:hypothetical protein